MKAVFYLYRNKTFNSHNTSFKYERFYTENESEFEKSLPFWKICLESLSRENSSISQFAKVYPREILRLLEFVEVYTHHFANF